MSFLVHPRPITVTHVFCVRGALCLADASFRPRDPNRLSFRAKGGIIARNTLFVLDTVVLPLHLLRRLALPLGKTQNPADGYVSVRQLPRTSEVAVGVAD